MKLICCPMSLSPHMWDPPSKSRLQKLKPNIMYNNNLIDGRERGLDFRNLYVRTLARDTTPTRHHHYYF